MTSKRHGVGEFEHLIMLAILRLGDSAYGVSVIEDVEETTGRSVSQAAAYLTLRRLEDKGWIESHEGPATADRGGRQRRYYRLSDAGLERVRAARAALQSMWEGVAGELDPP